MLGLPHVGLPHVGPPPSEPFRFGTVGSQCDRNSICCMERDSRIVVLSASSMPPARLLYVAAPAHFPLKQHSSHELQRPNSLRSTRRNADSQNCYGLVLGQCRAGPVPFSSPVAPTVCCLLIRHPRPQHARTHARTMPTCATMRCTCTAPGQHWAVGLCCMLDVCMLRVARCVLRVGCSHLGGTGPSSARSPTATAAGTGWYWQYSRGGTAAGTRRR